MSLNSFLVFFRLFAELNVVETRNIPPKPHHVAKTRKGVRGGASFGTIYYQSEYLQLTNWAGVNEEKACDMCRTKKIKCQPTENSCQQCIKYSTLCHFTPISLKRAPRRAPGQKRVEELEGRLKKMEEKLKQKSSFLSAKTVGSEVPRQTALISARPMDKASSSWSAAHLPPSFQDSVYDLINGVQRAGVGATSPSFLLMNCKPEGWILPDNCCSLTRVDDVFSRRVIRPLPPKPEALALIQRSFQGFSSAFPIFNQTSFLARFESTESPYEDPGWWACLNVVLALAHRSRSMISLNSRQEDILAWGYFQNALAVATELTMLNNTLTAVQALLGMAVIVQGSPSPTSYASLSAAAMKLAQTIDLHRSQEGSGLPREVIEERKRVFWIAYYQDRDVCIRTRKPPILDDEDMDVELPSPSIPDLEYLNHMIGLAKIQGQVYKHLLSVAASRRPYPQRVIAIQNLEAQLEAWRDNIAVDFQHDYFYVAQHSSLPEPLVRNLILRLVYFNTLNAIHSSTPALSEVDGVQASKDLEHHGALPPPITFVAEARKAIKLLHVTPQGEYACIWIVLHIFVSATKTLLNHLIADPGDALAKSDLQLIDPLLKLLGMLAKGERSVEVTEMYEECNALFDRATKEVEDFTKRKW
ncbi:uncharacterized protein LY89DRAFT_675629 [Mollisia scopiformis]|uniref:Zn(2)-C6 fungal-type domain-containing protein n=1 Tax=Mollisia scopiformis TaxID=149040 RepID=A0A132BCJ6_MOLSC|nr:uncharacterized protein LY89DRAFT_675629 [Mollisia scopiformis]KUJ10150.1 hypothetical protein LY89DRAFT_675629 [Mollisia scopiformis]